MSKKNPLLLLLFVSLLAFVFFLLFVFFYTKKTENSYLSSKQKIFYKSQSGLALLELKGVILDSKKILEQIDAVAEESAIKGVVLRINSPGGSVAPSQEIYQAVKRLSQTKPVYASMGSVAASGGYYAACGAKKIFANPGTITGSIGVIMQFADLSKLYDWAKVNPYTLKTGKFKDTGTPTRPMSLEEKELLQGMIENVLTQFRRVVAEARGLKYEEVIPLSDGRIFSGEQAKAVRLVDELGGIEDAALALAQEVGISGKPELIKIEKRKNFIEQIFSEFTDEDEDSESKWAGFAQKLLGAPLPLKTGLFFLSPYWIQ